MVKKCLACSTETILWNNTLLNTNYCVAGAISFKLQKYFMALFKIIRTVLLLCIKNNSIMRHQNCKDGSLIKQHNFSTLTFSQRAITIRKVETHTKRFKKFALYSLYLSRNILIWFNDIYLIIHSRFRTIIGLFTKISRNKIHHRLKINSCQNSGRETIK